MYAFHFHILRHIQASLCHTWHFRQQRRLAHLAQSTKHLFDLAVRQDCPPESNRLLFDRATVIVLAHTLRVHVYVMRATGDLGATTLTEPCTSQGCRPAARSSIRYAACKSRRTPAENRVFRDD